MPVPPARKAPDEDDEGILTLRARRWLVWSLIGLGVALLAGVAGGPGILPPAGLSIPTELEVSTVEADATGKAQVALAAGPESDALAPSAALGDPGVAQPGTPNPDDDVAPADGPRSASMPDDHGDAPAPTVLTPALPAPPGESPAPSPGPPGAPPVDESAPTPTTEAPPAVSVTLPGQSLLEVDEVDLEDPLDLPTIVILGIPIDLPPLLGG